MLPPAIPDPDLGPLPPFYPKQGRQKAVESMRDGKPSYQGCFISFEPAPFVVHPHPSYLGDHPICHAGGKDTNPVGFLSVPSPTRYRPIPLFELLHKDRDYSGVVLPIAIHVDDPIPLGVVEAGREGRRLAGILFQLDDPEMVIFLFQPPEDRSGLVRAPVVYQHDLIGQPDPLHNPFDLAVEGLYISLLIMEGDGNGNDRLLLHGFWLENSLTLAMMYSISSSRNSAYMGMERIS